MPKIEYQKQFNDSVDNVIITINKHLKEIDIQERGHEFIKHNHKSKISIENIGMNKNNFKTSFIRGKDSLKSENKETNKYKQSKTNRSIEK